MHEVIKDKVFAKISGQKRWKLEGNSKIKIENKVVHFRFCSTNDKTPTKYKFNINPNTLSSDFELWICGNDAFYYLIPINIIKNIYQNPEAYIDNRHPEIRVVSIDAERHSVIYARGGQSINLEPFFQASI